MRATTLVVVVGVMLALSGCASVDSTSTGPNPATARRDSFGDPYITDAQARRIHKGMSARRAFRVLGGKSDSGSTGQQIGPVLGYDYPIRGTGNPDNVMDDKTIWWQFCIGYGRVQSKERATMGNLTAVCSRNFS